MDRAEKKKFIETMRDTSTGLNTMLVVHYQGLSVSEVTELRSQMHETGSKLRIVKNRLMKIALKDTEFEQLAQHFTGPVAIAYSEDPVSAAKGVVNFAKENEKLKIIAGVVDKNLIDEKGIKALAKLPSLDELRAKFVGLLSTPATRMATVTQAPAQKLARVFAAFSETNN